MDRRGLRNKKIWRAAYGFAISACLVFAVPLHAQQAANPDVFESVHKLFDEKKFSEAEELLRSYMRDHLTSADAHFLLGYALFRQDHPKESLAEFTQGAKFRRPNPSDLKIVAADYVVLGDYTDADKWLTMVTKETPMDAEAWYMLGRTKYSENRFQEAIQAFQRILSLSPKDTKAENNLGLSYEGLNRLDEAQTAFETAIEWQKEASIKNEQPYLNLGSLLADRDQLQAALTNLQQAEAMAPNNPKILEQLGRVYDLMKQPDKAEEKLLRAIALAPDVSGLHFRLGQVYKQLGKRELAQEQFAICQKLASTHSSSETPNPVTRD